MSVSTGVKGVVLLMIQQKKQAVKKDMRVKRKL